MSASSSGAPAAADVPLRLSAPTGAELLALPNIAPVCDASTKLPLGNGI